MFSRKDNASMSYSIKGCDGKTTTGRMGTFNGKDYMTENTFPNGSGNKGGGYGHGTGGSKFVGTSSKYGLHNLKELPRIASDTEFAATCHGSIAINSIIDHAIIRNAMGYGADALASLRILNLSYNGLHDEHIRILNEGLYGYTMNLQTFNLSYNNMGAVGLDHLIKGSIGIEYLRNGGSDIPQMMQGIFTLPMTSIVHLNLSNNNIGDLGAGLLTHAMVNRQLPAIKYIDVSGNNITEEGNKHFVQLAKNIQQPIKITVDTLYDGLKKQGILAFGSKEAKQSIVQDWLNIAESNGVDTQNVAVSNDIFDTLGNVGSLTKNFLFGWVKCSVVPENVQSFAADIIITKVSPKAAGIMTGVDIALCYFESLDESLTSQQGVQFLGDLGLLSQEEFLGAIE